MLKEKLDIFIKNNLVAVQNPYCEEEQMIIPKRKSINTNLYKEKNSFDINNFINNNKDNNQFTNLLFKFIDRNNLKDSDVYNKAGIDRRLFSKIRSNEQYHPKKETVIALGLSLNLSIDEMEQLLSSASYSLPKNNIFDLIIRFCVLEGIYDILEVNTLLSEYNCQLLGNY